MKSIISIVATLTLGSFKCQAFCLCLLSCNPPPSPKPEVSAVPGDQLYALEVKGIIDLSLSFHSAKEGQ
jgi:hypothetical protein